MEYFGKSNQSPWAANHRIPIYQDSNGERRWDIDLDEGWIRQANEQAEAAFRSKIIAGCSPDIDSEQLEVKLKDAGKKSQVCVSEKELRQDLKNLFGCHLRWHPLTHLPIFTEDALNSVDIVQVWRDQTDEMHRACKEYGLHWAWIYLWTNWYRPDRWVIWARAVCKKVPISQSNAIVESFWSTHKRRYLRKHSRAKLEFLVDIIMNYHLPDLKARIEAYRNFDDVVQPVWYLYFPLTLSFAVGTIYL